MIEYKYTAITLISFSGNIFVYIEHLGKKVIQATGLYKWNNNVWEGNFMLRSIPIGLEIVGKKPHMTKFNGSLRIWVTSSVL